MNDTRIHNQVVNARASMIVSTHAILSLFIIFSYGWAFPAWNTASFGFFSVLALNQFFTLYFVIGLLGLLVSYLCRSPRWLPLYYAVTLTGLNIFLFVDRCIYSFLKFHFNSLVLSVLTNEAGRKTLGLNRYDFALLGCFIAALMALQIYVWHRAHRPRGLRMAARLGRARFACVLVGLGCISADKALFSYADATNQADLLATSKLVPLYQPFTVKRFLKNQLNLDLVQYDRFSMPKVSQNLSYPKASPAAEPTGPAGKPLNFLWIVIDSWRSDMVTNEVMPNVHAFSQMASRFEQHFSGGNNTRMGMFTLYYGLHGYYWHSFLAARRGPILYDRLKEIGYESNIFSSASLDFPEFRKTIFSSIRDSIYDSFPGKGSRERDAELTTAFIDFLDERHSERPFFSTLFYDSAHTKYHYMPGFGKFKPDIDGFLYADTFGAENLRKIKNRYKNSLYYTDHVVGRVFAALKERGLLDNTVVMLTGDHGDEFRERGHFGHHSAYTPEQIQVPLIIYHPQKRPQRYPKTSTHQDIAPTFMRLAGDLRPPASYSFGRDLFVQDEEASSFVVACTWQECALKDSSGWFVFGTEPHSFFHNSCFDKAYQPISCKGQKSAKRVAGMVKVVNQMSVFTN